MSLGPVAVPGEENLSATERNLLSNAVTGTLTDLQVGNAELDDPAQGATWGADRQIRAELLIELLRGTRRHDDTPTRAVKLQGASITGSLDLEAAAITCPLLLDQCYIAEPVNFDEATAAAIRMPGCYMPAFTGRQLRVTGDLSLADVIADEVDLHGAHIGGHLNMFRISLTNPGGVALNAGNLTVEQGMFCVGLKASGGVWLGGARIGGELDLYCATLTNPGGTALSAGGLTVGRSMSCSFGFTATGGINLDGAHIHGELTLLQARVTNPDRYALSAEGLTVDQGMSCYDLTANGQVSLRGARIGSKLNLDGATLTNPGGIALWADNVTIGHDMSCGSGFTATGEINLRGAQIGALLNLDEARLSNPGEVALSASMVTVGHSMSCRYGFTATGEINLDNAHIHGELTLSGARVTSLDRYALSARGLTVDQGMSCDRLAASGEVFLRGARIGSELNLDGATLTNPGRTALSADNAAIGHDMSCGFGFTATGRINLDGASIGGQLNLDGASIGGQLNMDGASIGGQLNMDGAGPSNPDRTALSAEGLTVDQGMSCGRLTASGGVCLRGARIGSELNLDGATLASPGWPALSADNAIIGHDMSCDGLITNGWIGLRGAQIGAELNLNGARLTNPGLTALSASNLTVGHSMSCGYGFTATGEINLDGAHIHGELTLAEASVFNHDRPTAAFWAQGLTVDHGVYCDSLNMRGEMSLIGASIGGDLDLTGASLRNPTGRALDLEAADIKTLRLPKEPPDGRIDLTNAKAGVLHDDQEGWPAILDLRGFVYGTFKNEDIGTRARLQWLKRDPGRFSPQLYDQLAATYQRAGDDSAARKVAIAKQWQRRRALNPFNWLWYGTVGYGYRTWLAGIWLVGLVGLGTWVFSGAYPAHMIALGTHPPAFHAAAYALDLLLPVISLGQKSAWQPQGSVYQYWSWVLTGAGWVLTTAVIAGLTGILKRS